MKANFILKIMNILFWIIFIGLCIKAGAILTSFMVSIYVNPEGAKDLYLGFDLSGLYHYDKGHYIGIVSLVIVLTGLKAFIAYLVIKISLKFNLDHPFNNDIALLILKISYVALATGVLALMAKGYTDWLSGQGANVSGLNWSASEILFFGGILFLIANVFRKGVEIQVENELTV